MSEAALAEPPVRADTQTAAAPAETQATPPGAGTDGGAPANQQAPAQTADDKDEAAQAKPKASSRGRTAEPPSPPSATKSEAEIRQDIANEQQERQRQNDLRIAQDELRTLRRDGAKTARNLLNALERELETRIPDELRDSLENYVETLNLKAYDAAKLELADQSSGAVRTLTELSDAFYDALDEDEHDDFTSAVRNKGAAEWVGEFSERREAVGRADRLDEFIDDAAELLPDEAKEDFAEALKKAGSTADVVQALWDTAVKVGNKLPAGEPRRTTQLGSVPGPQTLRDAELMYTHKHPSGQRITLAQLRDYQARAQRGEIPRQ